MANSLAQMIALYKTERDHLQKQLVHDAATGLQPDMSFDGQNIQNQAWRQQIYARLRELQLILAELEPFEITQVHF